MYAVTSSVLDTDASQNLLLLTTTGTYVLTLQYLLPYQGSVLETIPTLVSSFSTLKGWNHHQFLIPFRTGIIQFFQNASFFTFAIPTGCARRTPSKIVGITKHTIIAIEYNKWVDGNLLQLNYTLIIEKQKITDTRKQKTAFETDYVRQEQEKVLACLE